MASDSDTEGSEEEEKPPKRSKGRRRLQIERTRSIEKVVRVTGVIKKRKDVNIRKRSPALDKRKRRELPHKLKARTVSKLEDDIKDLAVKVSKSLGNLSSEIRDDIHSELLRFQVSIQNFHKESKLFFNSSVGKYLNSLLNMLETAETSSGVDLNDLKQTLRKVINDSARVVTFEVDSNY